MRLVQDKQTVLAALEEAFESGDFSRLRLSGGGDILGILCGVKFPPYVFYRGAVFGLTGKLYIISFDSRSVLAENRTGSETNIVSILETDPTTDPVLKRIEAMEAELQAIKGCITTGKE